MAYKNQNYMTNPILKEQADKKQKDYISLNTFSVIDSESSYNNELETPDSALNRYYTKWPREDGIDAEGKPVRDANTEVVGHSWESAITAPTDPAKTSTFPWIALKLNDFIGNIIFKYDGEEKFNWNITNAKKYAIISVPNDLNMPEYRLEWGSGNLGEETFNPDLLQIEFVEKE